MLRGEEKVKVKPYDMADVDIIDAGGPISAIRRGFDFKSNDPKLTQLEVSEKLGGLLSPWQ